MTKKDLEEKGDNNEELKDALDNIEKGQPRRKFRGCLKAFIIFLIVLGIAAVVLYFVFLSPFAFPGTGLKGESKGQINILVLGRGGEGHSGANLTDTIMLVMIRNKDDKVGMLSIPRDLWVETDGYGGSKINAVYSQAKNAGESDKEAIGLVEDHVKDITGVDPGYYALIDFNGVAEIVDTIGGINVTVDTAFTDTLHSIDYPKGVNNFDGEEAVMYTRARYATSGEGSDFQRADRQQDLLMGIKDKALSSKTLLSPSKLSSLSKQYKKHIITNLSTNNLSRLMILIGGFSDDKTTKSVYSTANVLVSGTSSGGAYILNPRSGDWTETRAMAKDLFNEDPSVQIFNGTKKVGHAEEVTNGLAASGYNVIKAGDADKNTYIQTIVYDNNGENREIAQELAQKYKGIVSESTHPKATTDITMILGQGGNKISLWNKIETFFSPPSGNSL